MKRKIFLALVILAALLTKAYCQNDKDRSITINGDTPWVISSSDYENISLQMAIRDVEKDWYKVFGYPPVIFHNKPANSWNGPVVIFGSEGNISGLVEGKLPEGKEQYHLFIDNIDGKNPALVAKGSDTRGTIYAIYTFSEEILGIDPLYTFTDSKPEKRSEISLESDFEIISKKPTFEYRGWFINDEELHDGMHRDPLGGNVISMEWMDKILEALLRTKGNMIIPESAPYPDATVYDLCKRRDVAVTHHHVTPLGLNMMDWPKGVPFSYITHRDILVDAWTKAVKAQEGQEIVWIIGFRGESDGAFWNSDPAAPTSDEDRAGVIAHAMQTQADIIRAQDPDATIVAALWNEQGRFYNEGLLDIPDGVCKMFADDGRGFMRDDGGIHVEEGDGLYYHVMMQMNTQNRTTEAVPPARFYSELRRYVEKGATKYAIINVSGIRPAAMSVEAMADFLWDAEPVLSKSPEESMYDYLYSWHAKQFSPELAEKLTDLRLNYYNIPYMRDQMPVQGRWKGARAEHLLQHQTQELIRNFGDEIAEGKSLEEVRDIDQILGWAKEPLAETAAYFPQLWDATVWLANEIPEERQDYYQFFFIYQVAVHMHSARALTFVSDAVDAYRQTGNSSDVVAELEKALKEIEIIIDHAHKAEYGKWETMFMHVRLMDIWKTRLMTKALIAKIEGKPYTSQVRGYLGGSFWRSAHLYMDHGDGVFPYFHEESGPGLEVLEQQ